MKFHDLQYYMHDGPLTFRVELAGILSHETAASLEQAWHTAMSAVGHRTRIVDITFLTSADVVGKSLLLQWHREGVQLVADSPESRELVEWIVGEPMEEPQVAPPTSSPQWRHVSHSVASLLLLLSPFWIPAEVTGATLRPDTVAAWDQYKGVVDAKLQERIRPGGQFLWTTENSERVIKVRAGEILAAPAAPQNPKSISGGLIHHWIGAVFLAHAKLDDVLEVTSDYDRYKDYYQPSVVASQSIAHDENSERFSMIVMSQAFFMKSAIDAEYHVTNVRLDEHRSYSISTSTRVQEIGDYGRPTESRSPDGEGNGYVWKLLTVSRMLEADGGVYLEMEAVVLSRDVPEATRLFVNPVVRRLSRRSLVTSLQQTADAVRDRAGTVAKSGHPAKRLGDGSAVRMGYR